MPPRVSSRKQAAKVPAAAAAAAAAATSDEEQQVSAESMVDATLVAKKLSKRNPNNPNPPVIRIITNKGRSTAIDTITKTKIKGPDMFNLVEQYLVQEIGEETPERAVPVK